MSKSLRTGVNAWSLRTPPSLGLAVLAVLAAVPIGGTPPARAAHPQSIASPELGYLPDAGNSRIIPIVGVPGASSLGAPLDLEVPIRRITISPSQDYAIAFESDSDSVVVIDLTSPDATVSALTGAVPAGLVGISPLGEATVVYDPASGYAGVFTGLPRTASLTRVIDAYGLPGAPTGAAVSDDGGVVFLQVDGGSGGTATLWAFGESGMPQRVLVDEPIAVAFLPNRTDAVVTHRRGGATLVTDAGGTALGVPLLPGGEGAAVFSSAAADTARVFLADSASGAVATVDLATRLAGWVWCGCSPTGILPLKGDAVFRLTDLSADPVVVLDAASEVPRIRLIPPPAPVPEPAP